MPDTAKWIWLSEALSKGTHALKPLLAHFETIDNIYRADAASIKGLFPKLHDKTLKSFSSKSLAGAEKIMKDCEKKHIRIITPLCDGYPERLKNIENPPVVLYAKGERINLDDEAAVAIVGTRKASREGAAAAQKLGREIAEIGGVVVSGLAKGIDAIAAEGALEGGGKTVAVLGSGVDICYPPENRRLMARILENGAVYSEYPPGVSPERSSFPMRNRIISGLSLGTVVVEAPEKSGSLITARYALRENRDVFAVPSDIFNKAAVGSNALLREGAIPVMSGADIMSEYEHLYRAKLNFETKQDETESTNTESVNVSLESVLERFSEDEAKILRAIAKKELTPDEIVRLSGVSTARALSLLTLLEIRGAVIKLPGNKFKTGKI